MRWGIIFIILILLGNVSLAQVMLDKTIYNFGIIDKSTNRIADFKLTNNSGKHLYLMRAEADDDVPAARARDRSCRSRTSRAGRRQIPWREWLRHSHWQAVFRVGCHLPGNWTAPCCR